MDWQVLQDGHRSAHRRMVLSVEGVQPDRYRRRNVGSSIEPVAFFSR